MISAYQSQNINSLVKTLNVVVVMVPLINSKHLLSIYSVSGTIPNTSQVLSNFNLPIFFKGKYYSQFTN